MGFVLRKELKKGFQLDYFNSQGELEFALKNLSSSVLTLDIWFDQDPLDPIKDEETNPARANDIHNGHRILYPILNP